MFNGTKQNVVASSDYECLIWGMKKTGPRGGEGGECHIGEGTQLEGIKVGGELRVWVQGFLDAQSPGDHWQKRQAHGKPIWGGFGEDMVLTSQVWKH